MRVDRGLDGAPPGLDVRNEPKKRGAVVAFGKALLAHQLFLLEHVVGEQEAVRRHELHAWRVRPARQQGLHDAAEGRFARRDRPGDADDVGDFAVGGAEETLRRLEQALRGGDIEGEQARQRQIDRDHLLQRDRLVDGAQANEILAGQGQRRVGAQRGPMRPIEQVIRRLGGIGRALVHSARACSARIRTGASSGNGWAGDVSSGPYRTLQMQAAARRLFLVAGLAGPSLEFAQHVGQWNACAFE